MGCCTEKAPRTWPSKGIVPYVGGGLKLTTCPLSYGFYADRSFTPNLSALLLEAYADRKAGIVPGWGQGSALYHRAMGLIQSLVAERESELIDTAKDD